MKITFPGSKALVFLILITALVGGFSVCASGKVLSAGIVPETSFVVGLAELSCLTNGKTAQEYSDCLDMDFKVPADFADSEFAAKFGAGETKLNDKGQGMLGGGADGYFEVDLGAVCTVSGYRVYNYRWGKEYCMNSSWKLVVSTDGEDWKEVSSVSGVTSWQEYNEYAFSPVSARYVRLCILGLYIGGTKDAVQRIRIYEWQVLGEGTPVVPEKAAAPKIKCDGETLRLAAVAAVKQLATYEWTPSTTVTTNNYSTNNADIIIHQYYIQGVKYIGPPYSRPIKSTFEMFTSKMKDGVHYGGVTNEDVLGMDCTTVVHNATSAVASLRGYSLYSYYLDTEYYKTLGKIKPLDSKDTDSEKILARYTEQEIYESYALLRPGDVVAKNPAGLHVRLITGATEIVRKPNGSIDGKLSTVISTETGGSIIYDVLLAPQGECATLSVSNVYTISKDTEKQSYSLKLQNGKTQSFGSWGDIYAKYPDFKIISGSSMRIDKKYTFEELIKAFYIASTLNVYSAGETDAAVVTLRRNQKNSDIFKEGLLGLISSNYHLNRITAAVFDKNGTQLHTDDYFTRDFNMYLSEFTETNEFLKKNMKDNVCTVKITVTSGPVTEVSGNIPQTVVFNERIYRSEAFEKELLRFSEGRLVV